MTPAPEHCHRCQSPRLVLHADYPGWARVTSDCKPWPPGGQLAWCRDCHLVQTLATPQWRTECSRIYQEYSIYHQSAGAEQNVFPAGATSGRPRSEVILESLRNAVSIPQTGRLLDLGCGNGAFLRAGSAQLPGWALFGAEFDDHHEATLASIPGFQKLYTGDWAAIPGTFDLISLVHVLEHIPDPQTALAGLHRLLRPEGYLFVEVPNCLDNPFMLLVADHCSHFGLRSLTGVAAAAGFHIRRATDRWVAKELSLVAQAPAVPRSPCLERPESSDEAGAEAEAIWRGADWLEQFARRASTLATRQPFGLFGTSIAATWLDARTQRAAGFFVDEDRARVGRSHLDRPILAPDQIPAGATVLVALPPNLAARVKARLDRPGVHFALP
jgi:SAM-dependent methyltransferase